MPCSCRRCGCARMRRSGYVRSAKEKKLWPSLNNRWARPD